MPDEITVEEIPEEIMDTLESFAEDAQMTVSEVVVDVLEKTLDLYFKIVSEEDDDQDDEDEDDAE